MSISICNDIKLPIIIKVCWFLFFFKIIHNYFLLTNHLKNHDLKKIIQKEVSVFYKLKVSLQLEFSLKIIHGSNLTIMFYNKYFFYLNLSCKRM